MNDGRRSDNNDISLEVLANLDIITDIKNMKEEMLLNNYGILLIKEKS